MKNLRSPRRFRTLGNVKQQRYKGSIGIGRAEQRHDMALPFLSRQQKKRDQIVAIDLGGRTTKAVHLLRKNEGYLLASFAVLDAPIYERPYAPEVLCEHLKNVHRTLGGTRTKSLRADPPEMNTCETVLSSWCSKKSSEARSSRPSG